MGRVLFRTDPLQPRLLIQENKSIKRQNRSPDYTSRICEWETERLYKQKVNVGGADILPPQIDERMGNHGAESETAPL